MLGCGGLTAVGTLIAVGGGRTAVGGLPAPGAADPLRQEGLPMLEGGRWLAMEAETDCHVTFTELNRKRFSSPNTTGSEV